MLKINKIAIFASGSGTNAENIIRYFNDRNRVKVVLVATENPGAFVVERAKRLGVEYLIFSMQEFREGAVLHTLKAKGIDFVVLAGFLKLIPDAMIAAFPARIVNIHPALLPKYGGRGMYGHYVHRAVIANGDLESGITIHYVSGAYDTGDIIFQAKCPVLPNDTPDTLAQRVHGLEYEHFPRVIDELLG